MVVKEVIQKTCKKSLRKIDIVQLFKELTINVYYVITVKPQIPFICLIEYSSK